MIAHLVSDVPLTFALMGELEKFRFDPGKQTRWNKVTSEFVRLAQNGR
jgi:hypothetical protein